MKNPCRNGSMKGNTLILCRDGLKKKARISADEML